MKLNKLFYLLVAVSAIFVACGNEEPQDTPKPQPGETAQGTLTVVEKAVDVAFYGGEAEINFSIEGGEEFAVPTVNTSAEWVEIVAVVDMIVINVDRNDTTEQRVATLKVAYGQQSFDVFVRQAAGWTVDVEFTAGALNGEYYGTKYSPDPNYFVILSANGTTGFQDLYLDSYYRFDMFSETAAGSPVMLPQGVYTFDYTDSGVGGTFGVGYSLLFQTFEDGNFEDTYYEDGIVIVTETGVEAYVQLTTGKVHHVVYEGSLEVDWLKFPEPDYYSTLTSDFTFNEIGGKLRLVNYGDYYGVGANHYSISMISGDEMNGPYFMLDVVTDNSDSGVASVLGTYTVAATEHELATNTYLAGVMDGTQYVGSWYMNIAGGYVDHSKRAPIVGGTITIAQDGGTYVVTYDCVDDLGHKVQGTYSCASVEEYSSGE